MGKILGGGGQALKMEWLGEGAAPSMAPGLPPRRRDYIDKTDNMPWRSHKCIFNLTGS